MAICRLACANFIYCVLDWRKELPARLSHAVYFSGCRFVFYNEHSHANMKSASSFSFFLCKENIWPWEPINSPKFAYSTCSNET